MTELEFARPPSEHEYGRFRLELVARILSERLRPDQTAQILDEARKQFPQAQNSEVVVLRGYGAVWQPYPGSRWNRPLTPDQIALTEQFIGDDPA